MMSNPAEERQKPTHQVERGEGRPGESIQEGQHSRIPCERPRSRSARRSGRRSARRRQSPRLEGPRLTCSAPRLRQCLRCRPRMRASRMRWTTRRRRQAAAAEAEAAGAAGADRGDRPAHRGAAVWRRHGVSAEEAARKADEARAVLAKAAATEAAAKEVDPSEARAGGGEGDDRRAGWRQATEAQRAVAALEAEVEQAAESAAVAVSRWLRRRPSPLRTPRTASVCRTRRRSPRRERARPRRPVGTAAHRRAPITLAASSRAVFPAFRERPRTHEAAALGEHLRLRRGGGADSAVSRPRSLNGRGGARAYRRAYRGRRGARSRRSVEGERGGYRGCLLEAAAAEVLSGGGAVVSARRRAAGQRERVERARGEVEPRGSWRQ